MFFDDKHEILRIANRVGTAVFVVPEDVEVSIKGAIVLKPEEKSVITIEQVRRILPRLSVKQTAEQFVIIRPADLLNEEAANALLKNLEEPGENVHFVLITNNPAKLLPTILSRAEIYYLRRGDFLKEGITADDKIKGLAKRLLAAKPGELVSLAEEITKKKDGVREYSLSIVETAIEMLYKSYFLTKKEAFLRKLPKFLKLYENLSMNGHVKLHLVADLI